ncbi:MAG TPA: cyclase family protein [Bellilinea sp.]|nr:cyclase family protein [Bellilinea sp.]
MAVKLKIHDISRGLYNGMPAWPGDEPFLHRSTARIGERSSANVSMLSMSMHCGTHIDAPLHFVAPGADVGSIELNQLIGAAKVIEVNPSVIGIGKNDLGELAGIDRLLIKTTSWDEQIGFKDTAFSALTPEAASYLVQAGVKVVGIDTPSISLFESPEEVHSILLQAGIVIIENLDLAVIEPGEYRLMCLPLKVLGAEGAPARAILIEE